MNHFSSVIKPHELPFKVVVGIIFSLLNASTVNAAPTGGEVAAGTATFTGAPNALVVNQSSNQAIINWQSFGIAAGESVQFIQPSKNAIVLNRVLGTNTSGIFGQLSANGKIFIINPNGVLFGASSSVNAGGLVASTMNISDTDFMNRQFRFTNSGSGMVSNLGNITTTDGGYVVLLAENVLNQGLITSRLGTVALVAGNSATMDISGDQLINVAIDQSKINALVENSGTIQANGGTVLLSTQQLGSVLTNAVNNSGIIQAQTIDSSTGKILLLAGLETGGSTVSNGTLNANAPTGGAGGYVETAGGEVVVTNNSVVNTSSSNSEAGLWLVMSRNYLIANAGGNETAANVSSSLLATNRIISTQENITIADGLKWNAKQDLSLVAGGDVLINEFITLNDRGSKLDVFAGKNIVINKLICAPESNVKLISDSDGTGPGLTGGTVNFGPNGKVQARHTTIRFNPDGYINTTEEIADYDSKVHGDLNAKAWLFVKAENKVYDGDRSAKLQFKANPNDDGEGNINLAGTDAQFNNKNVGSFKPVSYTGYSVEGVKTERFELYGGDSGITFADVTPAPLMIKANDQTKTFGNTFTFNGTEFISTGLKNGETVALADLSSLGSTASANVPGSPYTINASNAKGGTFSPSNYTISYVNGQMIVTPAPIIVTPNEIEPENPSVDIPPYLDAVIPLLTDPSGLIAITPFKQQKQIIVAEKEVLPVLPIPKEKEITVPEMPPQKQDRN
jgi:filamentous hemagglutinin family protein